MDIFTQGASMLVGHFIVEMITMHMKEYKHYLFTTTAQTHSELIITHRRHIQADVIQYYMDTIIYSYSTQCLFIIEDEPKNTVLSEHKLHSITTT